MSIPKKYLPDTLTKEDREKQKKSIEEGKDRPKVDSYKSKRSKWVVAFEKKYDTVITDDDFISKVAKTVKETCQLVEAGFEYVCDIDGIKVFRKRK